MKELSCLNLANAISISYTPSEKSKYFEYKVIEVTSLKERFLNLFRSKNNKIIETKGIIIRIPSSSFFQSEFEIEEFLHEYEEYYYDDFKKEVKLYPYVSLLFSDDNKYVRRFKTDAEALNFYNKIFNYAKERGLSYINFDTMTI